ncbi:hypothetical protein E2C01_029529 [Portunus trituberculatus]|uniref:Uncharacterized protein n=1 Tax=Portunus trituberculatus TaxID=210409 RepID=A0A5B7EPL2_PORTR|nr:hypothetical protein [Portunus trituberculatus]
MVQDVAAASELGTLNIRQHVMVTDGHSSTAPLIGSHWQCLVSSGYMLSFKSLLPMERFLRRRGYIWRWAEQFPSIGYYDVLLVGTAPQCAVLAQKARRLWRTGVSGRSVSRALNKL